MFFHKKPYSGPPPETQYPLISPVPEVTVSRDFSEKAVVSHIFLFTQYALTLWPTKSQKRIRLMELFIPQGFKVAYVVFTHSSAVRAAMSVPPDTLLVASSSPEEPILTGVKS